MIGRTEKDLAEHIVLASPGILFEVAKDLQEFIRAGVLKEIGGNCSVFDIDVTRDWPNDVVEIQFESIPSQIEFRLSFETYHGLGGTFGKVDK